MTFTHRYLMASCGNNLFHVWDCKDASQVGEVHRKRECGGPWQIFAHLEDLHKAAQ